ncbi:Signal peptidase subunit [Trachipleistophora hominis]|uniref:Signal peptidase complex subunit 1 n=1 Tax=Trachipleistophora hominis TaxID=72359 RepID=L7JSG5_TRAHO|nr:Signal peptidase subunit [Trachipleistophora hominis]
MFKNLYKTLTQPIDYYGQDLAKKAAYNILLLGYSLAWIVGYFMSDLRYTFITGIVTVLIAFIVVVPPWPFYRRNPFKFKKLKKVD